MKRPGVPPISAQGQAAVAQYATYLRGELDLTGSHASSR